MIKLFQERNPFLVPVLLMLTIALKWAFISLPLTADSPTSGGILDHWIYGIWIKKLHPSFLSGVSVLIIFFSGLFFNYLLTEKRMFLKSHLLTALSFVLLTSIFAGTQRMHPGIIMLPFTLLLFRQTTRLYQSAFPKTIVANIGVIFGTGILLYHPFWWMLPFCMLALSIMRPFRLNEWILFLISAFVPVYLLLSYQFLTDSWNPSKIWPIWNPIQKMPDWNLWWIIAIALVGVWFFLGIIAWQKSNQRMLIETRKNWILLVLLSIFCLPSLFFPNGNVYEGLTLLLLPVSAFCTYLFIPAKTKWYHLASFWFLVCLAIANSWAVINNLM